MDTNTPAVRPAHLHEWEVVLEKTVDETTTEVREGQSVSVTRKVVKPVATKMALKNPLRRELRESEVFYAKRVGYYVTQGLITRATLINKLTDSTGGVLSQTEKDRANDLLKRLKEIEAELKSTLSEESRAKLTKEQRDIQSEAIRINNDNEAVFSHTAEAHARRDQSEWFAYHFILSNREGKWEPYFEGKNFEEKRDFMWKLEKDQDPFYAAAMAKIITYVQLFTFVGDNPAEFAEFDARVKKNEEEAKAQEAAEATKPVETAPSV